MLVVDDDPDVRDLLAALLAKGGYNVELASDGAEAIDALSRAEVPPDAILTDLEMPGAMGNSVIDFVHEEERLARIPIAVLSGAPELAPPGVQVFKKPVRAAALLAYLESQLH